MQVKGSFELRMQAEPPFDEADGVVLSRATFEKQFSGPLHAHSKLNMMAAATPVPGSAGYVALERITGSLEGKTGSFVVAHLGTMAGSQHALTITIVPDSGTAELVGIKGKMEIEIVAGQHFYLLDYTLGE